jgi:hypothetical protein
MQPSQIPGGKYGFNYRRPHSARFQEHAVQIRPVPRIDLRAHSDRASVRSLRQPDMFNGEVI